MTKEIQAVTASIVPGDQRLTFLPTYFGSRLMMRGETLVYAWMRRLNKKYRGAYWNFYTLTNGGFYMAPELDGQMTIEVHANWYTGDMSADAAGIVATMFALGQLASESEGTNAGDDLINRYHFLREFAGGHAESSTIFRAID